MKGTSKTKQELIAEISALNKKIHTLEQASSDQKKGRKRTEPERSGPEGHYHALFQHSKDAMLLTRPDGAILDANPAACEMFGRSLKEIQSIGRNGLADVSDPRLAAALDERARNAVVRAEITMLRASGDKFPAEITSALFVDAEGRQKTSMIIRDMTEKHKAEQDYQMLFREMLDGFALHEVLCNAEGQPADYRFLAVNPAFERMTGLQADEIVGRTVLDVLPGTERRWIETYGCVALTGEPIFFENYSQVLDKYFAVRAFQPAPSQFACIFVDITDHKRAEEALRESENKYRRITDNIADVVWIADANLKITYVSRSIEKMVGEPRERYLQRAIEEKFPPDALKQIYNALAEEYEKEKDPGADKARTRLIEVEHYRADGTTLWIAMNISIVRDGNGGITGFQGISRDITERRQAREEIKRRDSRYQQLIEHAEDGIFTITSQGRFILANAKFCQMLGCTPEKCLSLNIMDTYPADLHPAGAKRLADLRCGEALRFERPLKRLDGRIVFVEATTWKDIDGNLQAIVRDITDRMLTEEKLRHSLASLRKAINTTIQVMVSAVEVRDPYTAGHQIRTADLARTIATEMDLPPETIDGIRMAGTIHDIGKLSIPSEILSKPTKLLPVEFSLIKEHARRGFEMLEHVESPWPLAEIVHQHHERMDGSGYPRNLQGEDILIEARILAVADVVESMASHRPYRPALGVGPALEEISKNRGILYDAAVVDACLRLFTEKGFQFK
ncbi:MAG: PAS domain S-box protein [Deltaproteobacteria bacterium]